MISSYKDYNVQGGPTQHLTIHICTMDNSQNLHKDRKEI